MYHEKSLLKWEWIGGIYTHKYPILFLNKFEKLFEQIAKLLLK